MAPQEPPPNITEFGKWLGYHLVKDWAKILKAPIAFFAVFVFSIGIAWLFTWQVVVPQKNEQLATKQERIDFLSSALGERDREAEKLTKQIEDLRIYRGQDSPPLKKKALIFVQQVREMSKSWKETDSAGVENENSWQYLKRFGLRAQTIRDDLDQIGQQSDVLDKKMEHFGNNYKDIRTIVEEIEKLANKIKD